MLTPQCWHKSDVDMMQSRALWHCRAVVRATNTDSVWDDLLMHYTAGPTPTFLLWRSCRSDPGSLNIATVKQVLIFKNAFPYKIMCFLEYIKVSMWVFTFLYFYLSVYCRVNSLDVVDVDSNILRMCQHLGFNIGFNTNQRYHGDYISHLLLVANVIYNFSPISDHIHDGTCSIV